MKISSSHITSITAISSVWVALAWSATAQTVDTSTGQASGSSTPDSTVRPVNPAPVRLVARMTPAEADFKVRGDVDFSLAGDALNVSGRIDGLEPNMRYQLAVPPGGASEKPEVAPTPDAPQPPGAGTPDAGRPDAGKPDGTTRPGAAGSGTQVTSVSGTRSSSDGNPGGSTQVSGALGILTADATGGANVSLTVRSMALTTGPGGIRGRMVTLHSIPAPGAGATPVLVASGALEVPEDGSKK